MSLYLCSDCFEKAEQGRVPSRREVHLPAHADGFAGRIARPSQAALGALLGGLIGVLAGIPVAVLVGVTAGALATGLRSQDADPEKHDSDIAWDTCIRCGSSGDIEICGGCGRPVCASHRQLIMGQEKHEGRTVYRHYIPEEKPDEDASFSLFQTLISGQSGPESPKTGYRLGDELYEIDEKSGELIPVPETESDESPSIHNSPPTDEWDFDTASVSPAVDDWGGSDAWSSMDSDDGNWEAGSADSEGG